MKVLEIKKNKIKNMLDIYFDDDLILTMYEEDYYRMNLYEKEQFTYEDIEKIKDITEEKLARTYAMKLILYKKRTKKEIEDLLSKKDIKIDIINKVIQGLEADGYLDDILYAKKLIQKLALKNKSKKQVEVEFKLRGLDYLKEIIDSYEDDEATLCKIFNKKFLDKDLKDEKTRFKIYNFFRSKGFSNEVIRKFIPLDR